MKLHSIFPFTYSWIIRHHLGSAQTVLDVGCGNGTFMATVNDDFAYEVTGTELFGPYIQSAKKTGVYKTVKKMDVRTMNFKEKSFDAVHCSQVVEHLTKKEGKKVIHDMESFARHTVIIGTPHGHFHQEEYDGNTLQKHHSAWEAKDFQTLGYTVYGQGFNYIYGEHGLLEKTKMIPFLKYILFGVSLIVSPFVYNNPGFAAHLIAVKKI